MKTGDIQSLKGWQMRVPRLLRGMWSGKGGRKDSLSGNWKLLKGTIGNGMTIEKLLHRFWFCKSKLRCFQDIPWFAPVQKSNSELWKCNFDAWPSSHNSIYIVRRLQDQINVPLLFIISIITLNAQRLIYLDQGVALGGIFLKEDGDHWN
jgi:hypothetical protein